MVRILRKLFDSLWTNNRKEFEYTDNFYQIIRTYWERKSMWLYIVYLQQANFIALKVNFFFFFSFSFLISIPVQTKIVLKILHIFKKWIYKCFKEFISNIEGQGSNFTKKIRF